MKRPVEDRGVSAIDASFGAGFVFLFIGFGMCLTGISSSPLAAGATVIAGAILVSSSAIATAIRQRPVPAGTTDKPAFVPDGLDADRLDTRDD